MNKPVRLEGFARLTLALAIALAAGCAVGPDYQRPAVATAPAFATEDADYAAASPT